GSSRRGAPRGLPRPPPGRVTSPPRRLPPPGRGRGGHPGGGAAPVPCALLPALRWPRRRAGSTAGRSPEDPPLAPGRRVCSSSPHGTWHGEQVGDARPAVRRVA
ncbi:hypothetical protein MC885_018707, partial [Smutsia gigantea]